MGEVFGLYEPQVEIKACCWNVYRTLIEKNQLIEHVREDSVYVVACYFRPRKKRGKGAYHTRTIEEAFEEPMRFLFIEAKALKQLIKRLGIEPSKQVRPGRADPVLKYPVKLTDIMTYLISTHGQTESLYYDTVHEVYGLVPEPEVPF